MHDFLFDFFFAFRYTREIAYNKKKILTLFQSVRMQTSGGVKRRLPSPLFFEQPARKRMRTDNDDTRIPQMPLDGQVIVVFDHDKLFDLDMSDEQTPKTINEIGTTQKGPPSAAIKTSTNVSYRRLRYNECMGILNALNDKQQYAYHMIEIKESMNDCQILSTAAAATAATKTVAVSAFGGSKIENTNNNRPIQKPTKPAVVNNTNNLNENNLLQTMSRSDRSFLKSTGKSFSDLKASKSMQSTNTQRESAASIFRKELLNQTFFMNSLDCSPIAKRLIRAKGVINLAQDPLPMIPSLAKPQAILHKVAVTELVDNNNNQIGQTKNQNNKIAKAIDELIKMMAKLKLLVAPRVNARPPVAVQKAQQIEIKRKISDDTMQTFQCKSSENKIPCKSRYVSSFFHLPKFKNDSILSVYSEFWPNGVQVLLWWGQQTNETH